ncbi:hypothetical protein [Desulfosoma sp.]|uniref:hypothetical protein n=1 Tax=Desulfosoma sp. TaxID=2603217 RepID=UPI00404B5098
MSSSCPDAPKRLKLEDVLPLGLWKVPEEQSSRSGAAWTLEAYLAFLEDIDAFGRAKAPAKLYSCTFRLPGLGEKRLDPLNPCS